MVNLLLKLHKKKYIFKKRKFIYKNLSITQIKLNRFHFLCVLSMILFVSLHCLAYKRFAKRDFFSVLIVLTFV